MAEMSMINCTIHILCSKMFKCHEEMNDVAYGNYVLEQIVAIGCISAIHMCMDNNSLFSFLINKSKEQISWVNVRLRQTSQYESRCWLILSENQL